jgi:hypothetical protein
LSELELRHARLLLEGRNRARERLARYSEDLEDFMLELRESGASARSLEQAIGVPHETIQVWTNNAKRRRDSSP